MAAYTVVLTESIGVLEEAFFEAPDLHTASLSVVVPMVERVLVQRTFNRSVSEPLALFEQIRHGADDVWPYRGGWPDRWRGVYPSFAAAATRGAVKRKRGKASYG